MAERQSSGFVDAVAAMQGTVKNQVIDDDITFIDGGVGNDQIAQASNGLGGYLVGDLITVAGSTQNDGEYEILAVAAGGGTVDVGTGLLNADTTVEFIALTTCDGGSVIDLLKNGTMYIFDTAQTASADTAQTGTVLLKITLASGTYVPATGVNGINLNTLTSPGLLSKDATETWSGVALATGTARSFRFFGAGVDPSSYTSADVYFDGDISTSGSELDMSNTTITSGNTTSLDSFSFTVPQS